MIFISTSSNIIARYSVNYDDYNDYDEFREIALGLVEQICKYVL